MTTEKTTALDDTEVASILGLKPTCLRKWRVKGIGPRWRRFGRSVRYLRSDVLAWMEAQPSGGSGAETNAISS